MGEDGGGGGGGLYPPLNIEVWKITKVKFIIKDLCCFFVFVLFVSSAGVQ